MKKTIWLLALLLGSTISAAQAQVAVTSNPDQEAMLQSKDPQLAKNKRFVYDFWREVFEAAHMDLAPNYMAEGYIQHNPRVPTGRQAFIDFFTKVRKPTPIEAKVRAPLVAILADGDLVTMVFVREYPEPSDPSKKYTTTWFDMFRIADGKIAEHWDPAVK
ncbi:MAG TPA: nuclear transport factor 2 family protein [Burkholderiales bacterium]|nr:nuclear transport factor 2 family protein [Burkholderiales bacterium]